MFADPQTITIATIAQGMPRVKTEGSSATYQKSDETHKLVISHQKITVAGKRRIRSVARLDKRAIVTNPLDQTNDYDTLGFYVVIDRPEYGFSQNDVIDVITGFKTWLDNNCVGRLYGQES